MSPLERLDLFASEHDALVSIVRTPGPRAGVACVLAFGRAEDTIAEGATIAEAVERALAMAVRS